MSPALLICDCVSWRLDLFEKALDRITAATRQWDRLVELRLAYRVRDDVAILVLEQGVVGEPRLGELSVEAAHLPGLQLLQLPAGGPSAEEARDRLLGSCDFVINATAVTVAVGQIRSALGMTDDRRRAHRLAVEVPCRYDTAGGWVQASAGDLSSGGAFIVTRSFTPDIGDRMRLELFPGSKRSVSVMAEVVRHAPEGFGARLIIDEQSQQRIYDLVRVLRPGRKSRSTQQAVRVPVDLGVSVSAAGEVTEDEVENLSRDGAFIRAQHPRPTGTAVHLDLKVKSGKPLAIEGRVVRVAPADGPRNGGFAVAFQGLDQQTVDRLDGLVGESTATPFARVLLGMGPRYEGLAAGLVMRRCEVISADDSKDIFEKLLEELLNLDLLVLNVHLAEGAAEDLLHRIRRLGGESELPVAVVSARRAEEQTQLVEAGATAVLEPIPDDALAATLVELITERRRLAAA